MSVKVPPRSIRSPSQPFRALPAARAGADSRRGQSAMPARGCKRPLPSACPELIDLEAPWLRQKVGSPASGRPRGHCILGSPVWCGPVDGPVLPTYARAALLRGGEGSG